MIKFWGVEEVGNWLESLGLAEYKEQFARHDVRGPELLNLDRPDLKVGDTPTCSFDDQATSSWSIFVLEDGGRQGGAGGEDAFICEKCVPL